jgi:hypothetical protein
MRALALAPHSFTSQHSIGGNPSGFAPSCSKPAKAAPENIKNERCS